MTRNQIVPLVGHDVMMAPKGARHPVLTPEEAARWARLILGQEATARQVDDAAAGMLARGGQLFNQDQGDEPVRKRFWR